jgi:hypothetical protein
MRKLKLMISRRSICWGGGGNKPELRSQHIANGVHALTDWIIQQVGVALRRLGDYGGITVGITVMWWTALRRAVEIRQLDPAVRAVSRSI